MPLQMHQIRQHMLQGRSANNANNSRSMCDLQQVSRQHDKLMGAFLLVVLAAYGLANMPYMALLAL